MSLIPYEARNALNQFHNDFNRMFANFGRLPDDVATAWTPAVDIQEQPTEFVVRADLPGIEPKDIEVTMQQGMLTISGKRESEKKEEKNGYLRTERSYGEFFRRLALPDSADADNIAAKTDKGVLEIHIPKREATKARRIEVKS
ncbi:Hsp20/alpha crystallin family protein [Solimonas soli]|uniref:Hsp20/alpha crystallin family protein n=1 Tax=Solimonas soli TaxID=413479 RepID=UPI00048805D8|nr:Hsp20/alpha crystallin family protein [Solimonas soli]